MGGGSLFGRGAYLGGLYLGGGTWIPRPFWAAGRHFWDLGTIIHDLFDLSEWFSDLFFNFLVIWYHFGTHSGAGRFGIFPLVQGGGGL